MSKLSSWFAVAACICTAVLCLFTAFWFGELHEQLTFHPEHFKAWADEEAHIVYLQTPDNNIWTYTYVPSQTKGESACAGL